MTALPDTPEAAIEPPKPASANHWPAKLAWQMVPRQTPPKRPACERSKDFREIYGSLDEAAVREQASRCIQCPYPSCKAACPLSNLIPHWLALAAEGRFLEAAALSQSTSNMPEICSRVCPQERLCEGSCILNARGEPVSIGAVERFINEYAFQHGGVATTPQEPNGRRVAVVGSGPGGMACADELVKLGYAVTVLESLHLAGGLLVNGIPSFKLDKSIVARRLEVLRSRGVEFRMGVSLGRDISLYQLRAEFDAVFLGIGAQKAKGLDVPGADLKGVYQSIPFLVEKNVNAAHGLPAIQVEGKRVVVLGGGDTAMDCLRTALRCGASSALCIYRRDFANMPGSRKEYQNAIEEGARFSFLTNPLRIVDDAHGKVAGIRCVRMELGEPDASGRRKPRPVPGSEFDIPGDVVLAAYGFDPVPFAPGTDLASIAVNDWGATNVDANQMTSVPGVFAGGDVVRGPSLVVHAVRDGRKAAQSIHQFIQSAELTPQAINLTQPVPV
jgi:glutamate synthase (NADPH/NADH) small chain